MHCERLQPEWKYKLETVKISANHICNEGFISGVYEEFSKQQKRKKDPVVKSAKRHFTKDIDGKGTCGKMLSSLTISKMTN